MIRKPPSTPASWEFADADESMLQSSEAQNSFGFIAPERFHTGLELILATRLGRLDL